MGFSENAESIQPVNDPGANTPIGVYPIGRHMVNIRALVYA